MAFDFLHANKVALTDKEGKTIYVKNEDVDKYVLTNRGWLLKDKVYPTKVRRWDESKGFISQTVKRTGWEIHLVELKCIEDWNKNHKPMADYLCSPEGSAEFERNKAKFLNEHPEIKKNFTNAR